MRNRVLVINIVGLTPAHIGEATPNLRSLAKVGYVCPLNTILPAVTCSAQATILTGALPKQHGIVGNGWYFRDLAEVGFWKQSHHLIQGETLYQKLRECDPQATIAKLFWWYNMYAPVDFSMTPRPSYPADGRKVMDSYSYPPDLKDELQSELGVFPLLKFWGPGADIESSRWIVDASMRVLERKQPTLAMVYLPHLDYNFQRFGPHDPRVQEDIRAIDHEAGRLMNHAMGLGYSILALSEYAITEVNQPIHINRALREAGLLIARKEALGWETLDAGASRAFAVADHQVAHVYVRNPDDLAFTKKLLASLPGVEQTLDREEQARYGIDHPRAGELVAIAERDAWFTYYFWLDDALAPDYARTVDIHRKPGYDPVELFLDPRLRFPKARVMRRLVQKKLGFRYYMDVIGLDPTIVKGSHGRLPKKGFEASEGPVLIGGDRAFARERMEMTDVKDLILSMILGRSA